jgi:hypothetical protein
MPLSTLIPRPRRRTSAPSSLRLTAGTYVTDEHRLFRCISAAPPGEPGATALMENCRTLEHVVFPIAKLDPEKLRIVQPALDGNAPVEPDRAADALPVQI